MTKMPANRITPRALAYPMFRSRNPCFQIRYVTVIVASFGPPFVLTVSGSFKTKSEILDWPPTIIPTVIQWQNYVDVWTNSHFFPQWILNSVFLAGAMFNAVPIILLVIFFQKYFIRSAASSAVKG